MYYGLQSKDILTKETIDVYNITGYVNELRLFKRGMLDHDLLISLVCEKVLSEEIFQSVKLLKCERITDFFVGLQLYSAVNDPQTANDPQIGPQMIPNRK